MLLGVSRAKVVYKCSRLTYLLMQLHPQISREAPSVGAVSVLRADVFFSKKLQRDVCYISEKCLTCCVLFTFPRNHFNFAMNEKSARPHKYRIKSCRGR